MIRDMSDLKTLDAQLEKQSMRGLWVGEEEYHVQPKPFGRPKLWKWKNIREALDTAAKLIPTNYTDSY
jgi:gentisate 1,2-dioxygenase